MSDTCDRGTCSNDLNWEIQNWTKEKVTLEFVDPKDRNTQFLLVTLTPEEARALARALYRASWSTP